MTETDESTIPGSLPETKSLAEVVADAREQFESLTRREVDNILGAGHESGCWRIQFEVVELRRIPDSTSLLGCYEVLVDDDGTLVEYGRVRRYYRNRADEEL